MTQWRWVAPWPLVVGLWLTDGWDYELGIGVGLLTGMCWWWDKSVTSQWAHALTHVRAIGVGRWITRWVGTLGFIASVVALWAAYITWPAWRTQVEGGNGEFLFVTAFIALVMPIAAVLVTWAVRDGVEYVIGKTIGVSYGNVVGWCCSGAIVALIAGPLGDWGWNLGVAKWLVTGGAVSGNLAVWGWGWRVFRIAHNRATSDVMPMEERQ